MTWSGYVPYIGNINSILAMLLSAGGLLTNVAGGMPFHICIFGIGIMAPRETVNLVRSLTKMASALRIER